MAEPLNLSRRERQIMDIIFAREEASALEVLAAIPDAPTRTSVRTLLRILEEKGHLTHVLKGREFYYRPRHSRERAGQSAFQRVVQIFFGGSLEKAVAAHLADRKTKMSGEELQRLANLIIEAKRGGK